jgi:two-component system, sensor histidine kinase and response regulator
MHWEYNRAMTQLSSGLSSGLSSEPPSEEHLQEHLSEPAQDHIQDHIQDHLLRCAVSSTHVGVTLVDARKPGMPLIYVNPAFERMTGYSAEECLGKSGRFMLEGDQHALDELRAAVREARSVSVVLLQYRKDGTPFWNELNLSPMFDEKGILTHFFGIHNDITARKHAQERAHADLIMARQQAEDAARLKAEFLSNVSHEFRTPLNAIIGYTEIQLAGMTGNLSNADYQERILANAENLLHLINDVLDLSKIEAGRVQIAAEPFDVADLHEQLIEEIGEQADAKGLIVDSSIDSVLPDTLVGDAGRITQIALNLLSNAVKFTEKGRVGLRFERIDKGHWALVVSDTGIGIPESALGYIFDEFRQLDGTSQRKYGGTGLGLAIVRKLAALMHGTVHVQSAVGEGSTFTVVFPLTTKKADAPE